MKKLLVILLSLVCAFCWAFGLMACEKTTGTLKPGSWQGGTEYTPHEHTYSQWQVVLDPTCTSNGYIMRECTVCGDKDYQFSAATGHSVEKYLRFDSDTHVYTCASCGLAIEERHTLSENGTCPCGQKSEDAGNPYEPDGGYTYTVRLYRINEKGKEVYFFPDSTMNISAQWEGADGIHTAPFDNFGVATVTGLDGEYYVSLSNLPAGYTYDPNGIEADNDMRDIGIVLLQYSIKARGQTHGLYDCIPLATEGAYMVTLTSKSEKLYFEYTPRAEGIYSVESIVDVRAGKINPKMDWYVGTKAEKHFSETIDGGGASGSYTKNFRNTLTVDRPEYVGNTWTFAIYADTTDSYPVDVYFKVAYVGVSEQREIVQAKGPFYKGSLDKGTWQWSILDNLITVSFDGASYYYTDGSFGATGKAMRFKLWKQEDGGDGFYHFFDMENKDYDNGWGPMLWTLIKGWDLVDHPMSTSGKLDSIAGQRAFTPTKNYSFFMNKYAEYAITIKDPRQTDSISVHPVNEELMKALQDLALANGYFNSGNGIAEAGPAAVTNNAFDSYIRVNSTEDNMFLLFCGYFK